MEFLLGQRFDVLENERPNGIPDASAFLKALHAAQFWANMRIFFGFLGRICSTVIWRPYLRTVHRFVDHYVKLALQQSSLEKNQPLGDKADLGTPHQSQNLVSALALQTDDPIEIRWQIIQSLLLMHETTSTLLSNTLFLLSRHPSIWEQLRKDLQYMNPAMTMTKLGQCRTLQNVLKECKHPKAH